MFKSLSLALLLAAAQTASAVQINGAGTIQVINGGTTTVVGCLSNTGKFIKPRNAATDCGTFSQFDNHKRPGAPAEYDPRYDLFTSSGTCTFRDPANPDAGFGRAFACTEKNYVPQYFDNFFISYVSFRSPCYISLPGILGLLRL